jgi:N-acetylglucosamine kinase-like BadF-type ATPase
LLVQQARDQAGLPARTKIALGAYFIANVDVPADEQSAVQEIEALGLSARTVVRNDVFAVLKAGSEAGWGIAVVSGAGINALGIREDGEVARFLALGETTGDWGGGHAVGRAGLGAAVRAGDGRGAGTILRQTLSAHFELPTVEELALAVNQRTIAYEDLQLLAPVVFQAATDGDDVAVGIVHRLADEVVVMVQALLRRLRLLQSRTPVILGGGTLVHGPELLLGRIRDGIARHAPLARTHLLDVPPVAGALLEALSLLDADPVAHQRIHTELRLGSATVSGLVG